MPNPLLVEPIAELVTERLLLRPPAAGDGPVLYEALVETLPELRRFLGFLSWVAAEPSIEGAELFCRRAVANFHARTDFPLLVIDRSRARLVGVCGLHRPDWNVPKFEVGYWCRTPDAGRGYISEAVRALSQAAADRLGAVRLEAITDQDNLASRRVAERAGFVLEGVLHASTRSPDGSLRDTCVYARVAAPLHRGDANPAVPR